MCRLLFVNSKQNFSIHPHLEQFAQISKCSKEYQGHGWGCAYLVNNEWKIYKNINPIWEDNLDRFGETSVLLAHARSAFRNEGIKIENNMPFQKKEMIFIFNGELHGVRIKENGRIGAEKILNFIFRFNRGNLLEALRKSIDIINKKTNYIRAINIIMSDKKAVYISSIFNEDPEYFTMHFKQSDSTHVICSDPYPNEENWQKISNNSIMEFLL
ncbi:class II glutamine amidotransferase [Acidobacteriota bacterium]